MFFPYDPPRFLRAQLSPVRDPGTQSSLENMTLAIHARLAALKHRQPDVPILEPLNGLVKARTMISPNHTHRANEVGFAQAVCIERYVALSADSRNRIATIRIRSFGMCIQRNFHAVHGLCMPDYIVVRKEHKWSAHKLEPSISSPICAAILVVTHDDVEISKCLVTQTGESYPRIAA
jgi:hypothetical protein